MGEPKQGLRWVLLAASVMGMTVSAFPGQARAQSSYPSQNVRVIVPFPAGSQTDLLARLVSDELGRSWKKTFLVENIAGAGGNVGTATVERSAPDGHTLLVVPPTFVVNPTVYKDLTYNPADWSPVSIIATVPYLLVARSGLPASNIQELLAAAKAKPEGINYASGGLGSSAQLCALAIEMLGGVKFTHVPYRGAAPALADVTAGHVDFVFDALATTLPLWKDGKVKVLGIGTKTRSPAMPDVPTIAESGLPTFEAVTWTAMVAPPKTPIEITEKLSAEIKNILNRKDILDRMTALNFDIGGTNPEQTRAFLARESKFWGDIAKKAGITLSQ